MLVTDSHTPKYLVRVSSRKHKGNDLAPVKPVPCHYLNQIWRRCMRHGCSSFLYMSPPLSATGQNQWLDQWCDFYNFSKTGQDIAHHDVTWELPWPGFLTCIHTPYVPPPPTNACSSQNGRTVKQSQCEKVYNYSAFELSIIEMSTGCDLKAKYDLTKSCTRNGLTQYMQKQSWETHLVEE